MSEDETTPDEGTTPDDRATPDVPVPAKSHRRLWLVAGAVGLVVVVGAVLALTLGGGDGGQNTLSGTFTLTDTEGYTGDWDSCHGNGGYSDFGPGMNVTVRDGAGTIIGSGTSRNFTEADKGDFTADKVPSEDTPLIQFAAVMAEEMDLGCTVVFEVDVNDADFYAVEVGRRGELSYSHDDLVERDWWVELSLGD